jgi:hypothetical protein
MILDQIDMAFMMLESPKEPVSLDNAFNYPNLDSRAKWREAIQKQLKDIISCTVWKKMYKSEMLIDL